MRSVDVHVKTLTPSLRTLLSSIFTPKQKPPSLPLPLYFSSRSSSPHASSRFFSNAVAVSTAPIRVFHGIRSFESLFAVRAFSSSTAASLQPQQNRNQNQLEEGSEKVPTLEVGDGNHGGLEEETKLSLPVRAYFFSTRYRFMKVETFFYFGNWVLELWRSDVDVIVCAALIWKA